MPTKPLSPSDLGDVLTNAGESFSTLRNARLFITGGTGFFGHWLLESLLHANAALDLQVSATVLTRSASAFRTKSPHIANHPAITLLEGDVRSFTFPSAPQTHIIHAATDSGGQQTQRPPADLSAAIVDGTRHVLDFAEATGAKRLLYVSSGAIYGRPTTLLQTPEDFTATLPPGSYEEAKLAAEKLCLDASANTALEPVIARCFAFVGPHLPLTSHFAIGNFLGSALRDEPIHIHGDGTPRRAWLYMSDLAAWLWTLLAQGAPSRAYNVGSGEAYSIAEAAQLTASTLRHVPIQIDGTTDPAAPINSYVPDVTRAQTELGLRVTVPLAEALRRTATWHAVP